MTAGRQLPLPFPYQPSFAGGLFLWAPSNETARVFLRAPETWPQGRLALWGESGTGKTHLLTSWAARSSAVVIAGAQLTSIAPAGLRNSPVAIDDADHCPNQITLLHLLNHCAEVGHTVLLAARTPPSRWPAAVPDLSSRLRAILSVELAAPEETLLRALLARLLADRQLLLSEELQEWLLLRLPRTAAAIHEAVARLDYASLAVRQAPSRALLTAVVAAVAGTEPAPEISIPGKSSDMVAP